LTIVLKYARLKTRNEGEKWVVVTAVTITLNTIKSDARCVKKTLKGYERNMRREISSGILVFCNKMISTKKRNTGSVPIVSIGMP